MSATLSSATATVGDVMAMERRRKHRPVLLNQVEEVIRKQKLTRNAERDVGLWKGKNDHYRKEFSSKETWMQLRTPRPLMESYKGIWFPHSTPKYSFITWLVTKNRIATGDKLLQWNRQANSSCIFCQHPMETRDHLFFICPYSHSVWQELVKGILLSQFTANWRDILKLTTDNNLGKTKTFILRYIFQNTIHSIWRERNSRRHGEKPAPSEKLTRMIDKNMRNHFSTIKSGGDLKYAEGIEEWFASRQN